MYVPVIDGLIDLLVAPYPLLEVVERLLHLNALIVGAIHHLVAVVGLQDLRVVTHALQEKVLELPVEL